MAIVFKLQSASGTTLFDFTSETHLVASTWTTTQSNDERWTETYSLIGKGTPAQIVDAVRDFEKAKRWVDRFWADPDYQALNEVWLYAYSNGEVTTASENRVATVYSISIVEVPRGVMSPFLNHAAAYYQMQIVRGAWKNSVTNTATVSTFYAPCGMAALTSGNQTTLPGWIDSASIKPHGGGAHTLDDCWLGIRPAYLDTDEFVPLWEAEFGTPAGGATTEPDAAASGSGDNCVEYTLTTTSTKILTVKVNDIATAASKAATGYEGRYVVLARARTKTTSAGTLTGFIVRSGSGTRSPSPEVFYELTTTYDIYELAEVEIRPGAAGSGYPEKEWGIEIYVRTNDAALVLALDCFVMMPSMRLVSVRGAGVLSEDEDLTIYSPVRTRQRRAVRQTYSGGLVEIEYDADHSFSSQWDIPAEYDGFYLVACTNGAITIDYDASLTWREQFSIYNEPIT